jgi:hypothetical protein
MPPGGGPTMLEKGRLPLTQQQKETRDFRCHEKVVIVSRESATGR